MHEKRAPKGKRWLSGWVRLLFFLAVLSLMASYLATYISPVACWPLAFFGLAYPLILVVNLFFFFLWMFRKRRKRWLISCFVLLSGCHHFFDFFQFNTSGNATESDGPAIKLVSYNVHVFDVYNEKERCTTRDRIFSQLQQADPDIVCFQEFYHSDMPGYFDTKKNLKSISGAQNIHEGFTYIPHAQQHFGTVTTTRFPILNKGRIVLGLTSNNHCIFTDVLIGKDTVRVYNVHLASIGFQKADYNFVNDVYSGDVAIGSSEKALKIMARLKQAWMVRQEQIGLIGSHLKSSPYPVILCGDFNDTPVSWCYRQCTGSLGLIDAFCESGLGIGPTYIGDFPSFRIDYIFHDKRIRSFGFERLEGEYSDHKAIGCKLQVLKNG